MSAANISVTAFLDGLPPEKRKVIAAVRSVIRKKLPKGYEEVVQGKLIAYVVPLARLAKTYNGHPLWYAALAAQKNHFTVHLMTAYGDKKELAFIEDGFKKAGKKLDMGKACIRFKRLEDIPLEVIGESIARVPVDSYVARYESIKRK
ncbi:MAG: DUF1801 domain-containing protein [Gemmatimonadota bacterium]|nr:DUF1801 domain-containing protein [Gemmatimonadota bacterium]